MSSETTTFKDSSQQPQIVNYMILDIICKYQVICRVAMSFFYNLLSFS